MGSESPTFIMPVTIKRLGVADAVVNFNVKALRKSEWSALRDANMVKVEDKEDGDHAKFTFTSAIGEYVKKAASMVAQVATGWDLEDEFTIANLEDMEDRYGGSMDSFLGAYDAAIFHGRLGN